MRAALPLTLTLLAAACVPAPRAPVAAPPPPPRVTAPPPAPVAADWRDWPVTPGTWRYSQSERGSVAMFAAPGQGTLAMLRCDRQGARVFLSVAGSVVAPVTVRTSSTARTLETGDSSATLPYRVATLAPTDPLLDAIAFSRGRFALSQPGAPPLVLPAWAEVGRVVEDCRP